MAEAVSMPRQGQSVETCIITIWYKQVGDEISKGDLLFSYETDKAAFDEEAKLSGILLDKFYNEGDEVPVLANIAVIGKKGEDISSFKAADQKSSEGDETVTTVDKTTKPEPSPTPLKESIKKGKIRISPRARKMAESNNIDIHEINGSGPNERIIAQDIEKVLSSPASTDYTKIESVQTDTHDSSIEKLSNIRKIIASKMTESLRNSAQLTHHISADARKILNLRKEIKIKVQEENAVNITINDIVCFALIKALKQRPEINVHFLGDKIRKFRKIHLGIAVDTERGLMVPALRNADDYSLQGLSIHIKKLAEDCRTNKVDPMLLQSEEGSFTVSNLGSYGIEMFTPVLNLPQIGILGVNTISYQARDMGDGAIGFIPVIGLSLTYDHRAIDGAPASHFLKELKDIIENLDIEL